MEMDLGELGKVGRASLLGRHRRRRRCRWSSGSARCALIGDELQHRAVRRRGADRDERRHHRPRLRRPRARSPRTEARIVLGAAVADDVHGPRRSSPSSCASSPRGRCRCVGVLGIVVGRRRASSCVGGVVGAAARAAAVRTSCDRASRSAGTLVAMALAFTLAFAELADAAKLAPIVGAFVAGLALGRSAVRPSASGASWRRSATSSSRCSSSQIGIDVDVASFVAARRCSATPAVLLVVAVVGKLAVAVGAIGTPGDKLLIGLGMLPRGEVGLIFATIGLHGRRARATTCTRRSLLVVLATTLVTPMLLRWRYQRLSGATERAAWQPEPRSSQPWVGSWTATVSSRFAAVPSPHLALELALAGAIRVADANAEQRAPRLVRRPARDATRCGRGAPPTRSSRCSRPATPVRGGSSDALDVLPRALPELAERAPRPAATTRSCSIPPACTAGRRSSGSVNCWSHRAARGRCARSSGTRRRPGSPRSSSTCSATVMIGFPSAAGSSSGWSSRAGRGAPRSPPSVDDPVAAPPRRPGSDTSPTSTRSSNSPRTTATPRPPVPRTSSRAALSDDLLDRQALRELHTLVETVLRASNWDVGTQSVVDRNRRRCRTCELTGPRRCSSGSADAPRELRPAGTSDSASARHAAMLARWRSRGRDRYLVSVGAPTRHDPRMTVDVVAPDRPGLLARVAGRAEPTPAWRIDHAIVATWPDGSALESFLVAATEPPPSDVLRDAIRGQPQRGTTGRRARRRRAGSTSTTPRRPGTRSVASRPTTSPGC